MCCGCQAEKFEGRISIIVDLLCSIKGRVVNVEIQQANTLDHFRRVRYHGAVITANVTDPGTDFKDVPDLVIVYVTPFDILKRGRTKYVVKKTALDIGDVIEDGETDVYINAEVDDQSQLAKLMSVFSGSKKYLSEFPRTAERIARFTEQEKGIEEMSECIRELFGDELDVACAKAMEKGREEGIEKGKEEAWKVMSEWFDSVKEGCSKEEILKKAEMMMEKIKG